MLLVSLSARVSGPIPPHHAASVASEGLVGGTGRSGFFYVPDGVSGSLRYHYGRDVPISRLPSDLQLAGHSSYPRPSSPILSQSKEYPHSIVRFKYLEEVNTFFYVGAPWRYLETQLRRRSSFVTIGIEGVFSLDHGTWLGVGGGPAVG